MYQPERIECSYAFGRGWTTSAISRNRTLVSGTTSGVAWHREVVQDSKDTRVAEIESKQQSSSGDVSATSAAPASARRAATTNLTWTTVDQTGGIVGSGVGSGVGGVGGGGVGGGGGPIRKSVRSTTLAEDAKANTKGALNTLMAAPAAKRAGLMRPVSTPNPAAVDASRRPPTAGIALLATLALRRFLFVSFVLFL